MNDCTGNRALFAELAGAADPHVDGCDACRRALAEHRTAVALLAEEPPPIAPGWPLARLELQLVADLEHEAAAGVARPDLRERWAAPLAALLVGGVLVAVARPAPSLALAAALALVGSAVLFARLARVHAGAALTTAVGLSGAVAALSTGAAGPHVLDLAHGLACAGIELGAAAAPLGALAIARRRGRPLSATTWAATAASGALAAQASLTLSCPASGAAHLVVFHLGGLAVAAIAGGVAGRLAFRTAAR